MLEKNASKQGYRTRSFTVYGPPGCGKTLHAEPLRKALGLGKVWDEGKANSQLDPARFVRTGVLYLVQERPAWMPDYARRCMPLKEALKHAGVTPFSGFPNL